jgi:hypothetical protein
MGNVTLWDQWIRRKKGYRYQLILTTLCRYKVLFFMCLLWGAIRMSKVASNTFLFTYGSFFGNNSRWLITVKIELYIQNSKNKK